MIQPTVSKADFEQAVLDFDEAARACGDSWTVTRARCYYFLDKCSRSFAAVIQTLHPRLRDGVCIFYLVLRGLDTVEDDMSLPLDRKLEVLNQFHTYLTVPGWTFTENALDEKDRPLMLEFAVVVDQFLRLPPSFQTVITETTKAMGHGMASYCQKAYRLQSPPQETNDLGSQLNEKDKAAPTADQEDSLAPLSGTRVQTVEEYDLYCHYVAGLVGHGLSRLFVASGLESAVLLQDDLRLSNSMGLFLQKINVTRDLYEDYESQRAFWPREIWGQYADAMPDLFDPKDNFALGRAALNHMCLDALRHVPDVLAYLKLLRDPSVFHFCAIPQVMAIATLATMFDQSGVMRGTVKIRKWLAVKLIRDATTMAAVERIFAEFAVTLHERARTSAAALDAPGIGGNQATVTEAMTTQSDTSLPDRAASRPLTILARQKVLQDTMTACEAILVHCGIPSPETHLAEARAQRWRIELATMVVKGATMSILAWYLYRRMVRQQ